MEDRERFAARVQEQRGALGLTQQDLANVLKVSVKTVNNWEASRTGPPRATTRAALEAALNWAPGSVRAILLGGDPAPRISGPQADAEGNQHSVRSDLLPRLTEELQRQGETYTTEHLIAIFNAAARELHRRAEGAPVTTRTPVPDDYGLANRTGTPLQVQQDAAEPDPNAEPGPDTDEPA